MRFCAALSKYKELDAPVSAEAAVRLHKARIEALTHDLQALQATSKQKSNRLSESDRELQALQKDKASWQKQTKQLESQVKASLTDILAALPLARQILMLTWPIFAHV